MATERLRDLYDTFTYSSSTGIERKRSNRYIADRLGHPDKGSKFEHELGRMKYLFRVPGINRMTISTGMWYLQRRGYDALMLDLDQKIIGHTAFQTHEDNSLHIFSVEVLVDYQGNGLALYMVEEALEEARKRGVHWMRIGGGGHDATNHIHQNFAGRADELRIVTGEGNWVNILH